MERINYNLISLKCVLFTFFAGLGCLFPFLPLHMLETGLTLDEARNISIVAPCVALLGPIIVGPLADKLAGGSGGSTKSKFGKYIRIIIAVTLILAAVFYLLLLSVPTAVKPRQSKRPLVTFISDPTGGVVSQERCSEERTCYQWAKENRGALLLSNCRYTCHTPTFQSLKNHTIDLTTIYPEEDISEPTEVSKEVDSATPIIEYDYETDSKDAELAELNVNASNEENDSRKHKRQSAHSFIEPPHLCYANEYEVIMCRVYTEYTQNIAFEVSLANTEESNDDEWCHYTLRGYFSTKISDKVAKILIDSANNSCTPAIQCDVDDPYESPDSVLAETLCIETVEDSSYTFWTYLIIRSIADIFPTAAIVLFDAAIIIATRETSSGRGDVGRQLAWGTLGFATFAPLIGYSSQDVMPTCPVYAIIMFAVFMVLAALIMLFANGMPLSPPEWWWHTKCGMLALPMSSVRHYKYETGALIFVLFLLGVFWSALDSYLPWHLSELSGSPVLIGLTITAGALPAIPFLWYAERIVDYCGHTNLLITAFTFYIIRYIGTGMICTPWWVLISESLEVFTLILMWVTAVLYLRHLIPRRFTVTGQALPVIAHFCIGRSIGAIFGGLIDSSDSKHESLSTVYPYMAITAAVVAIIYFCVYHICIRPFCATATNGPPRAPPTIMQSMNGNGSYTPLRIYHNGRARKGQFRY